MLWQFLLITIECVCIYFHLLILYKSNTPFDMQLSLFNINLQVIAEDLKACDDCGQPLQLHKTNREVRDGLNSLLYVECICGMMNKVYTNKSHRAEGKKTGRPIYDVNTKTAMGRFINRL